ncbi:MAG TPA: zinc-ribbon domain-containing protein [Anaeromyxobacter sp.]|nr:zinc-ribbon domain-containing protein [Anaeromyxobacter sp.]
MIVICTGCQARFRVADEKVGPRGAKVRCSRCRTVFVVKREEAPEPPRPAPGIELELTPGLPRHPPVRGPSGDLGGGASAPPLPAPVPQPTQAPDPFAAAGLYPAEPAQGPPDDPFVHLAERPAAAAPPPSPAESKPVGEPDPFAPPPADPFAAGSPGSAPSLPVTDLSQLLGAPAVAPQRPPSEQAGPFVSLATDLALEERPPPGPSAPFADPSDVLLADLGQMGLGGLGFEARSEEPLALATEKTGEKPAAAAPPGEPPLPPPLRPGPAVHHPIAEERPSQASSASPPLAQEPRLRATAVNALALVGLLAVALAFRMVLSGEAPLGPSALRPSNLLRALWVAPRHAGPFEVTGLTSSVYHQTSGGALLLVKGEVLSRAPGPVEAVRLEAELLRHGEVIARGAARAGAVPTPEEVDKAVDRAALEAMAAAVKERAPKVIAPGDRIGFLIPLGDAPENLAGTSVRVRAEAEGTTR